MSRDHVRAAATAIRPSRRKAWRLAVALLLLSGAALLAGCGAATFALGNPAATATLQPVAACSTPPQNHSTGVYIWAIPAMGASDQIGVAQVCGLGFHAHVAIMLSLARYSSSTFTLIPNLAVTTDGTGAFSTAISVGNNWACANLRIHADDGQGASATTRLSPDEGTATAQPAGCPAPPRT